MRPATFIIFNSENLIKITGTYMMNSHTQRRHKDHDRLVPIKSTPTRQQPTMNTISTMEKEHPGIMSESAPDQTLFTKASMSVGTNIRTVPVVQLAVGSSGSTDQFNQYLQEVRRARVHQALTEVTQVVKDDTGIVESKKLDDHKLAMRDYEPWRPNYHTLNISGEKRSFLPR
jgi:hypothetical protein